MHTVIIRGPAGVGKSAVSRLLARRLSAWLIGMDRILEEHGLDRQQGSGISEESFIRADSFFLAEARDRLGRGQSVVVDGCFYRKAHLKHLQDSLPEARVFSLQASLKTCLERNSLRRNPLTEESVRAVFSLVGRLKAGEPIQTEGKTAKQVADEIEDILQSQQAAARR